MSAIAVTGCPSLTSGTASAPDVARTVFFMFSTPTVITYTGIAPRWVAYLGFALALSLLFGSSYFSWVFVAFPFWVFLISICLLTDEFRRSRISQEKA